jgi:PAS domain S-box-containing protein
MMAQPLEHVIVALRHAALQLEIAIRPGVRYSLASRAHLPPAHRAASQMKPFQGLAVQQEIAELRRVQQELRESEARHRAIVEAALDAIITIDADGRITEFNSAAQELFGHSRDEVIGRDLADTIIPVGMREGHRRGLERHRHSPTAPRLGVRLELSAIRSDGSEFPIELTVCRLGDGSPTFTAFIREITDSRRDREEIARLNTELEERVHQRTRQLEAAHAEIEAFSYSIAHDLRSPLTSIDGFSHSLEQMWTPSLDPQGQHYLRRIRAGVRKMSDLTDAMLSLAHLSRVSLRFDTFDLAMAARDVVARLRELEPERQLEIDIPDHLPAQGDARLLTQVIANLVGNAWKFSSRKPVTFIQVGSSQGVQGETIYFIADRGVGFDMAHASRLFGAFHRLHSPTEFEGTGIGLALVEKIVGRHGGRVWARAEPGQGATFYFTLASSFAS